MRIRIYIILAALLCIATGAIASRQIYAQTSSFSKISPKSNETLWKKDYTYTWVFSWKPYTAGTFDHYVIKFFNNDSTRLLKQITVPGGASATSMTIDFTNMTEIVKGTASYNWSLGAYIGSNTTPVAEADGMPMTSSLTTGFTVPLYTPDTKTWTINATVQCPANTVLIRNVQPFWAAYHEFQNIPWNDWPVWQYGDYSQSMTRTKTLTNRTAGDQLYFGLYSDVVVTKKLWWGGTEQAYQELIPQGLPWAANMNDPVMYHGTNFNPYRNDVVWYRDKVPGGTYNISFAIPTPYESQWCATPTPTPTSTPTPTPTPTTFVCPKTTGDANCDGQVNEADYTIWRCEYLGNGTCASPLSVKTADFSSPSDGKVDLTDFEIWRAKVYGTTNIPTPPAP